MPLRSLSVLYNLEIHDVSFLAFCRMEGRNLFYFTEYRIQNIHRVKKICRETPTKAQPVPLSGEPPMYHNTVLK